MLVVVVVLLPAPLPLVIMVVSPPFIAGAFIDGVAAGCCGGISIPFIAGGVDDLVLVNDLVEDMVVLSILVAPSPPGDTTTVNGVSVLACTGSGVKVSQDEDTNDDVPKRMDAIISRR